MLHRARLRGHLAPKKIGILGGSFNPPHAGHLCLSVCALKRLGLDEVWWLVSPQNPMKPCNDTRPVEERLYQCKTLLQGERRIFVSDFESTFGLQLSADSARIIQKLFPETSFVWLAGSDILEELHKWERDDEFVSCLPLAIFARPGSVIPALNSPMARRLARYRYVGPSSKLIKQKAPCWMFLSMPMSSLSSTELRLQKAQKPKSLHLQNLIEHHLDQLRAQDVIILDIKNRSSLADSMIVATGNSTTHVKALAERLIEKGKKSGFSPLSCSGKTMGDWILIDFGDIIVHLFREEVRAYYQIEKLWDSNLTNYSASENPLMD